MGACPAKTKVTSRIFINGRQEGQSQNRGVTAAALDRSESCAVEMEEGTTAERTQAACRSWTRKADSFSPTASKEGRPAITLISAS